MKSRALVAMMLVGAFLVAPNAAADTMSLNAEPPTLDLDGLASAEVPDVSTTVDLVDGHIPTDSIDGLLECQLAIRVPVAVFGGNTVDSRERHLDVLVTVETVLETVTRQVPVMGLVEQVVWTPSGILSALPPVTKEVLAVVGYEDEVVPADVADLDYNVVLDWREDKIAWTQMDFDILLQLPAGAEYLRKGLGDLVTDCSGATLLASIPDMSQMSGYEYVKVKVGGSDRGDYTHWYMRILGVDVSLAGPEDVGKDSYESTGLLLCGQDLIDRADAGIVAVQAAILRGDIRVTESDITGEAAPAVTPASAGVESVSASSLVGSLAGIVAALGAAFAGRRFF